MFYQVILMSKNNQVFTPSVSCERCSKIGELKIGSISNFDHRTARRRFLCVFAPSLDKVLRNPEALELLNAKGSDTKTMGLSLTKTVRFFIDKKVRVDTFLKHKQ
ncbi:hypothetical protein RvY_05810 [Ramazzottius varieornatus]|uniref:Uncharacterized protein n=1 Tax=Ramazzottius varieornatus TaxID=947166 RepID=A0A1D1UWC5_RAMVA|nr:hypothetical protein RvY_05810 [Ramazzottius varieornatus]